MEEIVLMYALHPIMVKDVLRNVNVLNATIYTVAC